MTTLIACIIVAYGVAYAIVIAALLNFARTIKMENGLKAKK